jgi:PPM family protein phosphatase
MALFKPLEFSALTHPGLRRDNNEDCFLCAPESGLWLVADGMGGHEAGEVASAIVRDTIKQLAEESKKLSITNAIQTSHQAILNAAKNGIGAVGMGSTVVALLTRSKNYQVAWVGDSRAYLWTRTTEGGSLSRITTDHSYVQMLFSSGALTAEELETHPDKNIITQCLGMQDLAVVNVDVVQGQWQENQWIILCSDGLSDEMSDEKIADILLANDSSVKAVEKLLDETLKNGGRDNITIQIIESPIQDTQKLLTTALNWVPPISHNRETDVVIFFAAVVSLIALLIVVL